MSDTTALTARVRDRVTEAGLAYDRRARRSRPKPPRAAREIHSLRRVFSDMGATYRQYRRETGRPSTPGLREATSAFKQAPTLPALVAVAAFLDELGILAW